MNLIIRNLDSHTTAEDIDQLLKDFDNTTTRQIKSVIQPHSGKLLTSAHIHVEEKAKGQEIIEQLNNSEYKGAVITVKESKS